MSDLVEKAYDRRAETYDKLLQNNFFKVYDFITWRYLEPYLPKNRDAVVLDAGGGTGRWSIPMAEKGLKVVLLDISEGMLNVARAKIREEGLEEKITVKQGDITQLEYPDETFDLVFCEHALFLIEDPAEAVRELARVLKKGDPLIISCPNTYTRLLMGLKRKFLKNIDWAMDALSGSFTFVKRPMVKGRFFTPTEFRGILEESGLRVEKIVGKVTTVIDWTKKFMGNKEIPQDLLDKILELETMLCERDDALGLAAHLQAIAYK